MFGRTDVIFFILRISFASKIAKCVRRADPWMTKFKNKSYLFFDNHAFAEVHRRYLSGKRFFESRYCGTLGSCETPMNINDGYHITNGYFASTTVSLGSHALRRPNIVDKKFRRPQPFSQRLSGSSCSKGKIANAVSLSAT